MNTNVFGTVLAVLLLFELAAARMMLLHETIIKANGDRIIRNWTTNDSEDILRNNDGVDEDFIQTASLLERDFGRNYLGQNQKNPKYIQPKENRIDSWTESQQRPTEVEALFKPSGVYVTHAYQAEPMPVLSADSYGPPKIIFAGNWQDIFRGWVLKENKPQKQKWQNEARNDKDEILAHTTDNNEDSLDAFLSKILGTEMTTATTTVEPFTHQLKSTDSDLQEINNNINQMPVGAKLDELLSSIFKVENNNGKERITATTVWPFTTQRRSRIEDEDYFQTLPESLKTDADWHQSNSANIISIENIR